MKDGSSYNRLEGVYMTENYFYQISFQGLPTKKINRVIMIYLQCLILPYHIGESIDIIIITLMNKLLVPDWHNLSRRCKYEKA